MRGKLIVSAAAAAILSATAGAAFAQADQPNDASTQARLGTSEPVTGVLSPAGDTDWYRLSVQTGQRYNITLESSGAEAEALADPMLVIMDENGAELARNDDNGENLNSALDFVPAASGDVFVVASGFGEDAAGSYVLQAQASDLPPDNAANNADTSARLTPGAPVNGAIEYSGDTDWFRLSVRPGQMYRITLTGGDADGALGDPMLVLYDAEGAEIASNDDDGQSLNSLIEYAATARGEMFVEARAFGDGASGNYTLNAEATRLPPDREAGAANTRARIAPGDSVDGSLDFPGDKDWFRITLEEGEAYRFSLNTHGGDEDSVPDPLLRILNEDGEELAVDDDSGEGLNSFAEFVAPSSGVFFLEASSFADAGRGGYMLTAAAGDIPADATTDASLSADGDYREGALAPAGDSDWFRIPLAEGQSIRVALDSTPVNGVGDPMLVIYGPDGSEVGRDDDGGEGLNSWLEYTAASAGPYYLEARGFGEDAEGGYMLSVTPGEVPGAVEGAEYLSANSEGRVSMIGEAGDADWFAIELIEGRPYRFNLEGIDPDPLADPLLTIYDAEGNSVATDDDGGAGMNSYLSFVSPTGGPYYAAVTSFDGASTGRYALRVVDTDVPGNAGTDEYLNAETGDDRGSAVEFAGDLDFYRVDLTAGVTYEITVSGEGDSPLADPFLTVLSSSAEAITTDDDSGPSLDARLLFTPEATDAYFIQASGLGGSLGAYRVAITRQE